MLPAVSEEACQGCQAGGELRRGGGFAEAAQALGTSLAARSSQEHQTHEGDNSRA